MYTNQPATYLQLQVERSLSNATVLDNHILLLLYHSTRSSVFLIIHSLAVHPTDVFSQCRTLSLRESLTTWPAWPDFEIKCTTNNLFITPDPKIPACFTSGEVVQHINVLLSLILCEIYASWWNSSRLLDIFDSTCSASSYLYFPPPILPYFPYSSPQQSCRWCLFGLAVSWWLFLRGKVDI